MTDSVVETLISENLLEKVIVGAPEKEITLIGNKLSDWRLSYGYLQKVEAADATVYFFSIYPAFCTTAKLTVHHTLSSLAQALRLIIEHADRTNEPCDGKIEFQKRTTQDVLAALFAISRNKESFELFQEQKDLMELGLQDYSLTNMYQDLISEMCKEYYTQGTLFCKPFLADTILGRVAYVGK